MYITHWESYTDSPGWIKKKKAIINSKYENDKSFQYAATSALNFEEINHIQKEFQILYHLYIYIIEVG